MNLVFFFLDSMAGYMLLTLPVWIVVRTLYQLKHEIKPRWPREVLMALFVLYLAGLLSQTLLNNGITWMTKAESPAVLLQYVKDRWVNRRAVNLVPLQTIRSVWYRGSASQKLINLTGNVVMFLPLGFTPPALWQQWRRVWKTVPMTFAVSCSIEFLQLFLGRSVDVDDVLLNTLGGLAGYILFRLCFSLFGKPKGKHGK